MQRDSEATFDLELPVSDTKDWFCFTSGTWKDELKREWYVCGEYCDTSFNFWHRNIALRCHDPFRAAQKNSIWALEVTAHIKVFSTVSVKPLWAGSCSNKYGCLLPGGCGQTAMKITCPGGDLLFTRAGRQFFKVRIQFQTSSVEMVNLSDPNNKMIKSPEDAAQIVIAANYCEKETLWLSKSRLGDNSAFFKDLFNGIVNGIANQTENSTGKYEIVINLDVFLHFLAVIYRLDVSVNGHSVEKLLNVADYLRCDFVSKLCEEYLFYSYGNASPRRTLILAQRYKLWRLLEKVVWEMHEEGGKMLESLDGMRFKNDMNEEIMGSKVATNGKIQVEFLSAANGVWTDFTSETLVHAGFEWTYSGQYSECYGRLNTQKTTLRCVPIENKENLIWCCRAFAEIAVYGMQNPASLLQRSRWSDVLENRRVSSYYLDDVTDKGPCRVEISLIFCIFSEVIDLSSPSNQMIRFPEDAAPIDIWRERVWVSKSILTKAVSAESPILAFLNSDLREECTGQILSAFNFGAFNERCLWKYVVSTKPKDSIADYITMNWFTHFISLIYGLDVPMNDVCLKYGEYFQCHLVTKKCEKFLTNRVDVIDCNSERMMSAGRAFRESQNFGDLYRLPNLVSNVVSRVIHAMSDDKITEFVEKSVQYRIDESAVRHMKELMRKRKDERSGNPYH